MKFIVVGGVIEPERFGDPRCASQQVAHVVGQHFQMHGVVVDSTAQRRLHPSQFIGTMNGNRSVRRVQIALARLRWLSVTDSIGVKAIDAR